MPMGPGSSAAARPPRPQSSKPLMANWASDRLTIGAGVAIFHVASSRVVLCYHSRDKYWFLPKGRRDVHETTERGAEREGFEESGYRNRLLPLPIQHRQPQPHGLSASTRLSEFVTEPVWTQLMPLSSRSQYLLFWYIAETLPPTLDAELSVATARSQKSASMSLSTSAAPPASATGVTYEPPPPFPPTLTLSDRLAQEPAGWEPSRHLGTGVDEEEALYESHLLPVEEAMAHLRGDVLEDVIRIGWEGIQSRMRLEGGAMRI